MSVFEELDQAKARIDALVAEQGDFMEAAIRAVKDGCPTKKDTGKPCDACKMAAERVRTCLASL